MSQLEQEAHQEHMAALRSRPRPVKGKYFVVGKFAEYNPTEEELRGTIFYDRVLAKRELAKDVGTILVRSRELLGLEAQTSRDLESLIARLLQEAEEAELYVVEITRGALHTKAEQKALYDLAPPLIKEMVDKRKAGVRAFFDGPEGQPEYLRAQQLQNPMPVGETIPSLEYQASQGGRSWEILG